MAEIGVWLRKTKGAKPNLKPGEPNCPKHSLDDFFCELSLHGECQFPRQCLSSISMVEEKTSTQFVHSCVS